MVCFEEADTDEFLHQGIPLALQTGFICIWERFLKHWVSPSLSKRKGRIAFFEIASELGAEWL
jgi:hypothetical protein